MNRIVLIGNGFDLAHGLKTSYADFIDWYWEQWMNKIYFSQFGLEVSDGLCSVKITDNRIPKVTFLNGLDYINAIKNNSNISFTEGLLIQEIMKDFEDSNWVDIESIYYRLLCESMKENHKITPKELNNQLSALTNKLQEYLKSIEKKIDINHLLINTIQRKLFSPIDPKDIAICASKQKRDYIDQLKDSDPESFYWKLADYEGWYKYIKHEIIANIKEIKQDEKVIEQNFQLVSSLFLPERIMFVNFNYTSIADLYIPNRQNNQTFSVNHIHGNLTDLKSIIFGYGDEMDKHYEELSERNDNEYLNNVKSIKYLEASNYRKLLEFVESAPYQIYIMGHSCGNSDRTLLNTLFEHENCVSIKPFYHKKEDGTDNYTDIAQNISRNFKDKKSLRDRVVNKIFCQPLIDKTKKEQRSSVEYYIDAFKNMKCHKLGGLKAPYKPIFMLSIIDLLEGCSGSDWQPNELIIEPTTHLESFFKNNWNKHPWYVLKFGYDINNVIFYMQEEPFYTLKVINEEPRCYENRLKINDSYYAIKLDPDLVKLLSNPEMRQQFRTALEEMLSVQA